MLVFLFQNKAILCLLNFVYYLGVKAIENPLGDDENEVPATYIRGGMLIGVKLFMYSISLTIISGC